MSRERPLNVDRYRKLRDKGRVSPRAAVVQFSASIDDRGTTTPTLAHRPGMMALASPHREAPATPQLPNYLCPDGLLSSARKAIVGGNKISQKQETNRSQQLSVSLFDESKRQRYERFRNKVRNSQSPKNDKTPTPASSSLSNQVEARDPEDVRYHNPSRDKYALDSASGSDLHDDKYAFPYNRNLAASSDESRSTADPKHLATSRRSAFGAPKTSWHQNNQSSANKDTYNSQTRGDNNNIPSPPSLVERMSTSNHPLNSFGLPIASARHGPSTPKGADEEKKEDLPVADNIVDNKRPTPTPKSRFSGTGKQDNRSTIGNGVQTPKAASPSPAAIGEHPMSAPPAYGHLGLRLVSSGKAMSTEKSKEQTKSAAQKGSTKKPCPEGPHQRPSSGSKTRPGLAVDTSTSTPSPKPVGVTYSYSSERGVTPPPRSQKTPHSVEGSESTSSSARRDRILESRGIVEGEQAQESRQPLNEMYSTPLGGSGTVTEDRNPELSLEIRPSLELPSLKSNPTLQENIPLKPAGVKYSSSENVKRAVTPLDFYKRITAEKSKQAAMARRRTGTTPTAKPESPKEEKSREAAIEKNCINTTPVAEEETPQWMTPIFRVESPRTLSFPMLDQRTVRLLYAKDFDAMIREHIVTHTHAILKQLASTPQLEKPKGISLFVRKRPLLHNEAMNGEFDVVNAETGQGNALVAYVTTMLSDLQTKDIQARFFEFDHVFAETRQAEDFYIRMAQAGILRARDGGVAAYVFFGGEGSGKTHSMADIEERAAYDLFETAKGERPSSVSVQYLELNGSNIMDLVGPASNHAHIVEEEGRFRIRGAGVKSALGHRDLLAIILEARRRLVQKESARGYVLCHISIHQKWSKGSLYLLGCPTVDYSNGGSGTMFDGLLRGIRAKAQGHAQDNPFVAANNVTRLLQEVFQEGKSHVSVLATVSPGASCTEETVSVLNTLASVAPNNAKTKQPPIAESPPNKQENDSPKSVNGESELTLPRQWSQEELLEWMTRKNLLGNKLPSDVNGRYAMRMSKQQLQQTFYDAMDTRKAEKLYKALRAENDRVARMRVKLRIAKERERTNSGQHY